MSALPEFKVWPKVHGLTEEQRADFIRQLLDVSADEHGDRIARINALFVRANGGEFYLPSGYRNPALVDGYNIVRKYLVMLALDNGVDITGNKKAPAVSSEGPK